MDLADFGIVKKTITTSQGEISLKIKAGMGVVKSDPIDLEKIEASNCLKKYLNRITYKEDRPLVELLNADDYSEIARRIIETFIEPDSTKRLYLDGQAIEEMKLLDYNNSPVESFLNAMKIIKKFNSDRRGSSTKMSLEVLESNMNDVLSRALDLHGFDNVENTIMKPSVVNSPLPNPIHDTNGKLDTLIDLNNRLGHMTAESTQLLQQLGIYSREHHHLQMESMKEDRDVQKEHMEKDREGLKTQLKYGRWAIYVSAASVFVSTASVLIPLIIGDDTGKNIEEFINKQESFQSLFLETTSKNSKIQGEVLDALFRQKEQVDAVQKNIEEQSSEEIEVQIQKLEAIQETVNEQNLYLKEILEQIKVSKQNLTVSNAKGLSEKP